MVFESELKKLGLKDKEAAVYLASLQLGPAPVQTIARKAKVVRATTYVVLEALMKDGLVTKYKEGKKTLFSAEPPGQLLRLIERERETLSEKQYEFEKMLPQLQILMRSAGDRPSVRYFEGLEGLLAMRQEIVMYSNPGDTIYNFTPMDHLDAVFSQSEQNYFRQRIAKRIQSKTIFTTRSEKLKKELLFKPHQELSARCYVSPEIFPSTSGMTIFRDRIAIGAFTGKLAGVIIESEAMADMMLRLFNLAWLGALELPENKGVKK